jgi:uncharacterized protein
VLEPLHDVYRSWSAGDWSMRFDDFYAGDFEWGWSEEFPDIAGVFHDVETPNTRLRAWLEPWESWQCHAEDYVVIDDVVVVLTRYIGCGRGSGLCVDVEGAHVWTLRNGRAIRLEVFADRAVAFESATELQAA